LTRLSEILVEAQGTAFSAAASFTNTRVHLPERVQIRDGALEWSDGLRVMDVRGGRTDSACLQEFVSLADGPPEEIARFVERHGPLFLGPHGLPVHADDLPSRIDESEPPIVGPTIGRSGESLLTHRVWYREPIDAWHAWARYVGTVLVLCHELRAGERIVPDVRLKRIGFDPGSRDPELDDDSPCVEHDAQGTLRLSELGTTVYFRLWPWRVLRALDACRTVDDQWRVLAWDVSFWLLPMVSYAVTLRGTAEHPRIELGRSAWDRKFDFQVHSAMPTVAGQLLATIAGGRSTQLCADCRLPYPVERRRKNGRCPECRRRARSASVQRSKARRRSRETTQVLDS
jgi:hypothetical protein